MGLLRNIFTGGKRPTVEDGIVRCGECKETIQPDADRCPRCRSDVFTLKGRVASRTPLMFGIMFFAFSGGGILGGIGSLLGLLLIGVGVYYIWKAPIYSLRPPHRPPRPEDQ